MSRAAPRGVPGPEDINLSRGGSGQSWQHMVAAELARPVRPEFQKIDYFGAVYLVYI